MEPSTNQFQTGQATIPPPMARGNSNIIPPQSMEIGSTINLKPTHAINRDTPRYVLTVGDHLPPVTKRNFRGILGSQLGGQVFDLIEVPCLWKFSGFVTRGRLTPLIKKPVMAFQAEEIVKKKAKEIAEVTLATGVVQAMPEVYRMSFPWDSLQTLLTDHLSKKGIVEVTALEGIDWDLRVVQEIQSFFFPNWDELEAGTAELPFMVKDFVAHIESRKRSTDEDTLISVADAYLESADKFQAYAIEVVQTAKESVKRGMNDRGWSAVVGPYAAHLAAQIGVNIETNQTVVVQQNGSASVATSPEENDYRRREIEAMEESNRLRALEFGAKTAPQPTPEISNPTESAESVDDVVTAPVELKVGDIVNPGGRDGTLIDKRYNRFKVQFPDGTTEIFEKDHNITFVSRPD